MANDEKIVIGLVGETGSGKDTVANHLKKRYCVNLFRFSYPLKQALGMFFDHPAKGDQAWLFAQFRERFGDDILHRGLRRRIERADNRVICINGLRMPQDEELVRSYPNSVIIYVTADRELRWKRSFSRGEKSDDQQTLEAFTAFEENTPTEKAVPEIGARAEHKIENTGGLDDLLAKVDAVMDDIVKPC